MCPLKQPWKVGRNAYRDRAWQYIRRKASSKPSTRAIAPGGAENSENDHQFAPDRNVKVQFTFTKVRPRALQPQPQAVQHGGLWNFSRAM
jgi:hypothetical protein